MLTKFKEYFLNNPNGSIMSALIFAVTTMNTDELIALLSAIAMLLSGFSSIVTAQLKARTDRRVLSQNMELDKAARLLDLERTKIELERLRLDNKNFSLNFELNQNSNENEKQ